MIPKELAAVTMGKDKIDRPAKDSSLGEWIAWIDSHRKDFFNLRVSATRVEEFDNFEFEAARTLYSQGYVQFALERMTKYAFAKPKSKHAIALASLALDTYVKSEDWVKANELANRYVKVTEWKGSDYFKKVFEIAADSFYKIAESGFQKKDASTSELRTTLSQAEACTTDYSKSVRYDDCMVLVGKIALQLHDYEKAEKYYGKIIVESKSEKYINATYLLRAQIREEQSRYADAIGDLMEYLKRTEYKEDDLKKKILHFAWISGDIGLLAKTMREKEICDEERSVQCEGFAAFIALKSEASDEQAKEFFKKAQKSTAETRSLWALAALRSTKKFVPADRSLVLIRVADSWKKMSPELQFVAIPFVSKLVAENVESMRKNMGVVAPMKADARSIERRIAHVKDFEHVVSRLMKMPWATIRVGSFNELAEVYADLVGSLETLPVPKEMPQAEIAGYQEMIAKLAQPFRQKSMEIRRAALELGSKLVVEPELWNRIADKYFTEDPAARDLPQYMLPRIESPKAEEIFAAKLFRQDAEKSLLKLFKEALTKGNLPLVLDYGIQAETKFKTSKTAAKIFKAMGFYYAGANAEALEMLRDDYGDFEGDAKLRTARFLLTHSVGVSSMEGSSELLSMALKSEEFIDTHEDALSVACAIDLVGKKVDDEFSLTLYKSARKVDSQMASRWADEKLKELQRKREIASQKAGGKSS